MVLLFAGCFNIQIAKRREPSKDGQMHFSGPGKCIWALPRPCEYQGLVQSFAEKTFKTSLKEFKKVFTFAFSNSKAFLCLLKMAAVHAFWKEQKAECIFQALKNAFGHGSACSGLVLELGIRLKSY